MGRKSLKSLEKQARLKEEKKQLSASLVAVKRANSLADPLDDFPAFRQYSKNGLVAALEVRRVADLSSDTVAWVVDLMRRNMKDMYNVSDWGWNEEKKREELTEEAAWYLIAYTEGEQKRPVAFSHFRFDVDNGVEVLYVYELQLEEDVRRKGLGKFMSQTLELIGFKNQMRKVVLTVFKHNQAAIDFYHSLRYKLDDTCPEDSFDKQFCYFILSKDNKNLKA